MNIETHWHQVRATELPWIDTAQMVEVDRIMIDDLHIELVQMMENAGRALARLTMGLFDPPSVTVYAGSGGNGGGGMVAARHLANMGVRVAVATTRPREEMGVVPAHQHDILDRMGVALGRVPVAADVAIDAVVGYGLRGAPWGAGLEFIEAIAAHDRVVSLDAPSGLDTTAGTTPGAVVSADATLTLATPKIGLRDRPEVGRLFVGDISVPPSVYDAMGGPQPVALFASGPIVEVV